METQLGGGNYVVYSSSGNSVTVTGLTIGTIYHVAVFDGNGVSAPVYNTVSPATGSQDTAAQPTTSSSSLSFSSIDGDRMNLDWTTGNGERRIVIAREGSPVDAVPVNGVDYLAATTSPFNTAPEISPGQKVVYDNTPGSLSLSGLQPGRTYYFRVYEYSVGSGGNAYLTLILCNR